MKYLTLFMIFLMSVSGLAQDWAKAKLEKSPRHLEWVDVKYADRTVKTFVAYPERAEKAPVVLVIHEIFGLTDWARLQADDLAEAGYIAVVPDLLSGTAPGGGGTAELGGNDEARKAIASLPPQQITDDLKAVKKYALSLPAANGKIAVAGFCWGGTQSFRFATNDSEIEQAHVFYGTAPTDPKELARIKAPVYGFYAENDARVNATLDQTKMDMKKADKTFDPVIYEGGGHGFMRAGVDPEGTPGNKKARGNAWKRWLILLEHLNG